MQVYHRRHRGVEVRNANCPYLPHKIILAHFLSTKYREIPCAPRPAITTSPISPSLQCSIILHPSHYSSHYAARTLTKDWLVSPRNPPCLSETQMLFQSPNLFSSRNQVELSFSNLDHTNTSIQIYSCQQKRKRKDTLSYGYKRDSFASAIGSQPTWLYSADRFTIS